MNEDELKDALDGLAAYDHGSVDSGIHDEGLRDRCIDELNRRLDADDGRQFMSRLLRDQFLSEEALERGYGYEDLIAFVKWLADDMGIDLW
jgi:hypothetical protein